MFKAYFDRSELRKPAPVMAVSGYLGSEEEWEQFELAWHRVLNAFGVDMFHMTEFGSFGDLFLQNFDLWFSCF